MNKVKCFIRSKSKAIAAGIGAIAAYAVLHFTKHAIDPVVKEAIALFVVVAITYIAPKNLECPVEE